MPSPGWQKHHYMGSATIHPHWEARESLAVEGVGWISHRNFTRHLVKEWGFSLGLIPQTRRVLKAEIVQRSGFLQEQSERYHWSPSQGSWMLFPKPQESEGRSHHAAQSVRMYGFVHLLLLVMRLLSSATEIRVRLNPYSRPRRPDFPRRLR